MNRDGGPCYAARPHRIRGVHAAQYNRNDIIETTGSPTRDCVGAPELLDPTRMSRFKMCVEGAPFRRYLFQCFPTCLFDMPRLLDWLELLSPGGCFGPRLF